MAQAGATLIILGVKPEMKKCYHMKSYLHFFFIYDLM